MLWAQNTVSPLCSLVFFFFKQAFLVYYWAEKWWNCCHMVFWHFQKIPRVISILEGLNLHPNMSAMELTWVLSFVLWGKNTFKRAKRPTSSSSLHTPLHVFSNAERFLPEQAEIFECMWQALKAHQRFCSYQVRAKPRKLPVCGVGTMLYLFTVSFFKGSSCKPLMFLECKQYCSSSSTFASITVSALFRNCPIC